jgi:CheY-like chemotaxis protein
VIGMLLNADGYAVVQTASGDEALKKAAKLPKGHEPSIVLADLQMPGLCGDELAWALRPLLPNAVLIAMSATPGNAEAYAGFVSKPFDPAQLRELIVQIDGEAAQENGIQPNEEAVILDERIYCKLKRMMPETALADIYSVCLTDTRKRAAQMPQLAKQDDEDLKLVRKSAHTVKGGAGMLGATMLAKSAALLELSSYRKDDLPRLVNKLLDSCDRLQSILESKAKPR